MKFLTIVLTLTISFISITPSNAQIQNSQTPEVRDISHWMTLPSTTVTVNNETFDIVRYRRPDDGVVIIGWPIYYHNLITGTNNIENMSAYTGWGGINAPSRFTHSQLTGTHIGWTFDLTNYNGSGESVVVIYLSGNQKIAFSIDNQTSAWGTAADANGYVGYAFAHDPWTSPESCIADQGQSPCYDYSTDVTGHNIIVTENPMDNDNIITSNDIATQVLQECGMEMVQVYKQPSIYEGVSWPWVYDNEPSSYTATTNATYTDAEIAALPDEAIVYVGVKDNQGEEIFNRVKVVLDTNLSTTSWEENQEIKVYPNPVSNTFVIDYKGKRITQKELLGIYNSNAQKVAQTFNINHLPSGIYIVVFQPDGADKAISTKLIKK